MSTGPSKEDLELYWQNSRQYFDELARHYQTADPEYYRKYIKPYYDNPFRSAYTAPGQTKSTGGGAKFLVLMIAVAVLGIAGAGVFFLVSQGDSVSQKIEQFSGNDEETTKRELKGKDSEKQEGTTLVEPEEEPSMEKLSDDDLYIRGAKYISEKKYDEAVFELRKIKSGSKRYKEAQQLIESVKYLKKFNK